MLKRFLSLLFFILLSVSSTAFAQCADPAKSLLGLTDADVSRNSSDFNCAEVAFLKRAGLSGFSYDDYLDKFKIARDKAQDLSRYGFTPDRDYFLRFLERYSAGSLFQKLKEAHVDSFTTLFSTSRNTFVNEGQVCSADFPDFSSLPAMAQPAYFIGNTIYDTLNRKLGSILPSKDGKSILKVGHIEKEITWHESCYSQDSFTQISATLSSCWLCPLYDYFFKAVSDVSYFVWHTVRKPMIGLIAIVFLLWFMITLIKMFMGQSEEELNMSFFTQKVLKKLGMIAIAAIILGTAETGYDLVQDFVNMVLTPLSELSVYISKQFLRAGECSYTPLSFTTGETMFNPEIKNNILCLVEQLLGVFMDYILLASALLLKSFSFLLDALLNLGLFVVKNIIPPLGSAVSDASPSIDFLKSLTAFFFTTMLAWVFIFSLLGYMFQTLFYMIDPIFKMGMMFLWLPFTFLNWIVDLGIDASSFSAQFKMLFQGFLLMIFTALIVSICGTILLGLMSSSESYEALQTAIRTNNFGDIWSAIDIDETIILRLIAGLIIIHTMMKKIPDYASKFADANEEHEVWDEMKNTFNTNYTKAKTQLISWKNNVSFFKKMKK